MLVDKIKERETRFDRNGRDSSGKVHTLKKSSIIIPGTNERMPFVRVSPKNGEETYYYRQAHQKQQIVLHFTMGYLHGDVATLTQPNRHVSVPFLIGRNGKIYNLFSSRFWSYHLGPGAMGGNRVQSQKTIAIEISNIGPLKQQGNNIITSYSKPGKADKYCNVSQKRYYQQQAFRKYDYYATFSNAQYKALILLLRYLTASYKIPRKLLPMSQRFETHERVANFKGIVSHVNYRKTGKVDIGPAFDWQHVIAGLSA
jgi:N-acetyl-anhydromuramyl-L-alanine amidase AmpD